MRVQAMEKKMTASSGMGLRTQGWLFAMAGAVAFSGKAIVAKLMYRLGVDAFAVVGMRMLLAFPLFLAMAWWASRKEQGGHGQATGGQQPVALTGRERWLIVGLGFSGYYLASTLDFMGLRYISAGLERAILYLNPAIVLLLSALWLRHAVKPAHLAAMAVSYVGIAIVWQHDWDAAHLVSAASVQGMDAVSAIALGSVLVFFSAVSYAVYLIGSGQMVQRLGSVRLVGLASCVACVMAVAQWLVLYLVSEGRVASVANLPWQGWALSALNAVFCTVLPVWMVMRGVQLIGASAASQVGMIGPLSTIWMAALWLDEPVTWRLLLGTGAVLAGMLLLARVGKTAPAPAATQKSAEQASPG